MHKLYNVIDTDVTSDNENNSSPATEQFKENLQTLLSQLPDLKTQLNNMQCDLDTLAKQCAESYQKLKREQPTTAPSAGEFATYFLATVSLLDEQFLTPLRNAQVFSAKISAANGTADGFDHAFKHLSSSPNISHIAFDVGFGVSSVVFAGLGFAHQYFKHKEEQKRGQWTEVEKKFNNYLNVLKPKKDVTHSETTEDTKNTEQDYEKQKRENKFLITYVRLVYANHILFNDAYDIIANFKDQKFSFKKKASTQISTESDSSPSAVELMGTHVDLDGEYDRLTHSTGSINNDSSDTLSEGAGKNKFKDFLKNMESSKLYRALHTMTTGFVLYTLGYWVLSMSLSLLMSYGGVHFAPFLPTVLSFGVPLILPLIYFGFKLLEKPEQPHQKEEEHALEQALDYAFYMEMTQELAKEHAQNKQQSKGFDSSSDNEEEANYTDGNRFSTASNVLDADIQQLTIAQQEKIAARKKQVSDFLLGTKDGDDDKAHHQSSIAFRVALGALKGAVFSLLLAWVALDVLEIVAKGNAFGVLSPHFTHPPAGFNPFEVFPDASIGLASALLAFVVVMTIYTAISHYFSAKDKSEAVADQYQNALAAAGIEDSNYFENKAEEIATKEQILENLREKIKKDIQAAEKSGDANAVHALSALLIQAAPIALPKFDGRHDTTLGIATHSDRHFRTQDDYQKFAAHKTFGKKGIHRILGFIEGAGTGSLIVRMLAAIITVVGTKTLHALASGPSLLVIAIPALILGLVIGLLKVYRNHKNSEEARQDKFIEEIPLRKEYAEQELASITRQLRAVNAGYHEVVTTSAVNTMDTDKNSVQILPLLEQQDMNSRPEESLLAAKDDEAAMYSDASYERMPLLQARNTPRGADDYTTSDDSLVFGVSDNGMY